MFCVFAPTNGQFSQSHQTNMMSVTHYLFPTIYTMFSQISNNKEAFEVITISSVETGKVIFDSPILLLSETIESYIPTALGFEVSQVTIRDRNGLLHYRSHSVSEKIKLTHLEAGSYTLSVFDQNGNTMSVLLRKT